MHSRFMTKIAHYFYLIRQFWLYHPSLFYGCTALCSCYMHFYQLEILIFPFLLLCLPWCFPKPSFTRLFLTSCLFLATWFYTSAIYHLPDLPPDGISGTAFFQMDKISEQQTPFGKNRIYSGQIKQFHPYSTPICCPCVIVEAADKPRMKGNCHYWITGTLTQTPHSYRLKPFKHLTWQPVSNSYNWTEIRYHLKQSLSELIRNQFNSPASGLFLAGLVTGEFNDQDMREQFAHFGLQHLLAISGFHFSLIASLINICLRMFLPQHFRLIILLILLTTYCLFLGPQPSILRAWIVSSLVILAELFHLQNTPLNTLGSALLILIFCNPLFTLDTGFQLSFAVTFAILLLLKPFQKFFQFVLTKRSFQNVLQMNLKNQMAYCLLTFLREALALTCAVNIFTLPLTLYFFGQFPLMSLLYNLFFPLLASLSLSLFFLATICFPLPDLSECIHAFNDIYTYFILRLTLINFPQESYMIQSVSISANQIIIYLSVMTLIGILWKQQAKENKRNKSFFKMAENL